MENEASLHFNGIDGLTGGPLIPSSTAREIAQIALGNNLPVPDISALENIMYGTGETRGVTGDPRDLRQTGWGVIFPLGEEERLRNLIVELLEQRRSQVGRCDYYREMTYSAGQTKDDFLDQHLVGPGPAFAGIMPYYILLVGSPEQIPYDFQFELDREYAVGRLFFADDDRETADAKYKRYATSTVEAESRVKPRRIALFGVQNCGDAATQCSARYLVQPLIDEIRETWEGWDVAEYLAEAATKQSLLQIVSGSEVPPLVFTASHGIFTIDATKQQREDCGALLCQEPAAGSTQSFRDFCFAARDVPLEADLSGSIFIHFACFSAGASQKDEIISAFRQIETAPTPFVAPLPLRLLSQGALAVIGHVGSATALSFQWPNAQRQEKVFMGILNLIKQGFPIGNAMELMNELYSSLGLDYYKEKHDIQFNGRRIDPQKLAYLWTGHIDARNFVLLGDPAIRLNIMPVHSGETVPATAAAS